MRTINGFAPPAFQTVLRNAGTYKEQTDTHGSGLAAGSHSDNCAGRWPQRWDAWRNLRGARRWRQSGCGLGVRPADIGRSYKNSRAYPAYHVQGGIGKNSPDRFFAGLGVDVVSAGDTPDIIFVVRRFGDYFPHGDTG